MEVDEDVFSPDDNENPENLNSNKISDKLLTEILLSDSELKFSYKFEKISELSQSWLSPPAILRELPWRILIMPSVEGEKFLSIYLQCNGECESKTWSCQAKANICLMPVNPSDSPIVRKIRHLFHVKANDWGFRTFISFNEIFSKGFCHHDDSIVIEIYVKADVPHGVSWDSKKHTGCVGLMNQGATCYMNSLLQTIFFTNEFRRTIYCLPTECDELDKSVALALQRVFYELQFFDKPVDTKLLTKSFGWNTMDSFMQHDVQEFLRVLLDKIEIKMKGTNLEGTVPKLFQGKMSSYIRCKNISYNSTREETFYDIQLNIKDCKDIYESFKNYIAHENLEGDNRYHAGEHGLQDAEKGVIFTKLPPVLHLHLMRFQYDPLTDNSVKYNERFEFYEEINLNEFLLKVEENPAEYKLYAILVHSGDNNGGHYVVYINVDTVWLKFDDDVVCTVQPEDAIEQNFGGGSPEDTEKSTKSTNAYMLCYIRKTEIPVILRNITESDIPDELKQRLSEDYRIEEIQKEEHRFGNNVEVKVVLEDQFELNTEKNLINPEKVHFKQFKMKINQTFKEFLQTIEQNFNIRQNRFRLWLLQVQNEQLRIKYFDYETNMNELMENIKIQQTPCFFLEIADPTKIDTLNFDARNEVLLFYKFYNSYSSTLTYLGHAYQNLGNVLVINNIVDQVQKILGTTECLNIYEELTGVFLQNDELIERLQKARKLRQGLNLVFEYENFDKSLKLPSYIDYLTDLSQRTEITFIDKIDQQKQFKLNLSEKMRINDIMEEVGKKLNIDARKLKFFKYSSGYSIDFPQIELNLTIKDLFCRTRSTKKIFYQKFSVDINELENKIQFNITYLSVNLRDETDIILYPNKNGTISDLFYEAKKQIKFSSIPECTNLLRFTKILNHRIIKIYDDTTLLNQLNILKSYRIDEVSNMEINLLGNEILIPVFHFNGDVNNAFGVPFFIRGQHGLEFQDLLDIIRKRLQISEKEWSSKYKAYYISSIGETISVPNDFKIDLNTIFKHNDTNNFSEYIGLDHVNKLQRKSRDLITDKSIKIYN